VGAAPKRPFIGRQSELERLQAAFTRAEHERAQVVVVRGEAGIGKSTLVERFTSALDAPPDGGRRAFVVVGQCVDARLVFMPAIEVLRDLADSLGSAFERVVGNATREVASVVPDLVIDAAGGPEPERERVFDGLCQVLGRASAILPLVVVIEDVHWADAATRDLVRYAVLTLGAARVLVVVTVRDEDARGDRALFAWLGELARVRQGDALTLRAFDVDECAEFVASFAAERTATAITDLHVRSGGNPFFLEQLAVTDALARREVPDRLRDSLAPRIAALPPDASAVAAAAAVIGPTAPHGLLADVVGLEPGRLANALRHLVTEGIITADSDQPLYRFRHALWQDAILDDRLPAERAELHRRVALALEAHPDKLEGGEQVLAPMLAAHWHAAGDRGQTLRSSVDAARVLAGMGLSADASAFFETALQLCDAVADAEAVAAIGFVDLLDEAAEAAADAGRGELAIVHLRSARTIVAGEPVRLAHIDSRLGRTLVDHGDIEEGVAVLDAVIAGAPPGAEQAVGWALIRRARVDLVESRTEAVGGLARRAAEIAAELGDDTMRAEALTTVASATDDLAVMDEALALARRVGDADAIIRNLHNRMLAVVDMTGRLDHVPGVLREYVDLCALPRSASSRAVSIAMAAEMYCVVGRFEESARLAAMIPELELAGMHGWRYWGYLFGVALCSGRLAEADVALERLRTIAGTRPDNSVSAEVTIDRAQLAWTRGESAALLDELRRVDDMAAGIGDVWRVEVFLYWAARIAAASAEQARASGDATTLAAATSVGARIRAARPDGPRPRVFLMGIDTELAALDGQPDPDSFAALAAAFEERGDVVETALCRVREIDAALAAGDRARAGQTAAAAYRTAAALGNGLALLLLEDRASRAGLDIDDARTSHGSGDGAGALTSRERDVLAALADGLSNRQIATRLYVGVRTVETHVSRVLAKLGATDRADAVSVAVERGLVHPGPARPANP
jgi:DNA-binding NarL/FixJ family response regulator